MPMKTIRYKRTTVTNPSTGSNKMRQVDEPVIEHVLAPINVRDGYRLYDSTKLHTSHERQAQKIKRLMDDSERLERYHRYSDPNILKLPKPTKEKAHYLKTKSHARYEKLKPSNKLDPRFISRADIDDFERAVTSDHRRYLKMNLVSASDLYELVDPNGQFKIEKGVSSKLGSDKNGSRFIQELDLMSQRSIDLRFQMSMDSQNINYQFQDKQSTTERTTKLVDIDNNSTLLTGRKTKDNSVDKRKNRLLPITNGMNNDEIRRFDQEWPVYSGKKGEINYDFPKTDDFYPRDIHLAADCLNIAHTPLRLLQRPTGAKRMVLYKPQLHVIPEIGGSFQQSENIDSARKGMLLSVPLSSGNLLYASNSRTEKYEWREVRNRINPHHERKPENTTLASSNNFDFMYRKSLSQYHLG